VRLTAEMKTRSPSMMARGRRSGTRALTRAAGTRYERYRTFFRVISTEIIMA
jgi:hypothetical protein